jgi:uncharacterized protein (TIGR04255 family)
MRDRPVTEPIVSFAEPPVVEVVAGVAFENSDPQLAALLAAFWKEHLRTSFPVLEQQPPYSPPSEAFPSGDFPLGGAPNRAPMILGGSFPPARLWAKSSDDHELLQLQPGYFACNWRKVRSGDDYDRWPSRRDEFIKWFTLLNDFLSAEGSSGLKVTQCEVTYINHIRTNNTWAKHSDFSKIFTSGFRSTELYPLEQLTAQVDFLMLDDGNPYGRVHAKILPALARDGRSPLYVFELTARGAPQNDSADGALNFLDKGREAIDRTFLNMTTRQMHEEWGIQ